MALLAEQKRKIKLGLDPRNTNWSNDDSKFGQKLMEKMGWEKGKGLGANEDGMREHIKASYKSDTRGLGCTPQDADAWIAHQDDFNELLKTLNSEQGTVRQEAKSDTGSKSADGQKRYYGRFARGRVQTLRTTEDLDCIFGRRKASEPSTPDTNSAVNSDSEGDKVEEKRHGLTTVTSSSSVQEYFAKKMAEMKARRGAASGGNSPKEEMDSEEVSCMKSNSKQEQKKEQRVPAVFGAVSFSYAAADDNNINKNEEGDVLPKNDGWEMANRGWYLEWTPDSSTCNSRDGRKDKSKKKKRKKMDADVEQEEGSPKEEQTESGSNVESCLLGASMGIAEEHGLCEGVQGDSGDKKRRKKKKKKIQREEEIFGSEGRKDGIEEGGHYAEREENEKDNSDIQKGDMGSDLVDAEGAICENERALKKKEKKLKKRKKEAEISQLRLGSNVGQTKSCCDVDKARSEETDLQQTPEGRKKKRKSSDETTGSGEFRQEENRKRKNEHVEVLMEHDEGKKRKKRKREKAEEEVVPEKVSTKENASVSADIRTGHKKGKKKKRKGDPTEVEDLSEGSRQTAENEEGSVLQLTNDDNSNSGDVGQAKLSKRERALRKKERKLKKRQKAAKISEMFPGSNLGQIEGYDGLDKTEPAETYLQGKTKVRKEKK